MIQAHALWADRRFRSFSPLLLMFSILCMLASDLFCGTAERRLPEDCFSFVSPAESSACLKDASDTVAAAGAPIWAAGQNAAAPGNSLSFLFRNEISSRAVRSAAFWAGFLFMGKILIPFNLRHLWSCIRPKPSLLTARFLRELFIQKKKDGKKRPCAVPFLFTI